MAANTGYACRVGAVLCKIGLVLLAIGIGLQLLCHVFYTVPHDRLCYLGAAFVLTSVLLGVLRRMGRPTQAPALGGGSTATASP